MSKFSHLTAELFVTFRAAPLDGGYSNPALHDAVELGLYVELWMLCLDTFQLDGN